MCVVIRDQQPADAPRVHQVLLDAFPGGEEAAIVRAALERGKAAVSLVAVADGEVVGHILFTEMSFSPAQPQVDAVGLGPVAVLPAHQGRGIGSDLIREGIARCRALGKGAVFVMGEPAFYSRFGFAPAGSYGIGNEYGVDDPFMAIELESGALAGVSATASYIPEFTEFSD